MVSESKFENSKHSTFNLILLGNGTNALSSLPVRVSLWFLAASGTT